VGRNRQKPIHTLTITILFLFEPGTYLFVPKLSAYMILLD
jgi:hypothetical protein